VLEHRALRGGAFGEQHQLVTALGEGEEESQERGAENQPARDVDVDRRRAGENAQHEARRDRHHVEDDDMFQHDRVEEIERQVRGEQQDESRAEREREGSGAGDQHRGGGRRDAGCELAGGNRPQPLDRMLAILGAITQVVDEIDRARRGAKGGEGERSMSEEPRIVETVREDDRRQHEEVLDPLRGA
jgi:hypothetical protein